MRRLAWMIATTAMACSSSYRADDSLSDAAAPEASDARIDLDAGTIADASDEDAGAAACLGREDCVRTVFVTSTTQDGARGGVTGADKTCQDLADQSTNALVHGREFRAWLSTPSTAAAGRFPHGSRAYLRADGNTVANDWNGLTSGTLLSAINVDETGRVVATSEVWTGTNASGQAKSATCSAWTNGTTSQSGYLGNAGVTTASWTDSPTTRYCNGASRLYCIEN